MAGNSQPALLGEESAASGQRGSHLNREEVETGGL